MEPAAATPRDRVRIATIAVLAAGILTAGSARSQDFSHPRFEVASIKPGGDVFSTRPLLSRGRLRWTTQLAYLIGYAYRLDFSRVSGEHVGRVYTLEATFDPGAADGQVRLMVQALLAERFRMRARRVMTEAEGYALTIGKDGPKVKASAAAPESDSAGHVAAILQSGGVIAITGRGASIAQLAEALGRSGVPAWDRTGLTGKYDFEFRYAADLSPEAETDAPSLATALRESLGLTLKKQKGVVETLVVDHIEEPLEN